MAEEKENKHNGGFITVIIILCVILAALVALATMSMLGYLGGSSDDESSEVTSNESTETTESSESSESSENDESSESSSDSQGGESHKHSYELTYVAPTCTEDGSVTLTCSECGASYTEKIDKLGHDWDNAYYGHDDTQHWLVCPRCGTTGDKENHVLTESITDPTCTGMGLKTQTCECGYQKVEAIDALGHDWDEGSVTTEPSCTEPGVLTHSCQRDGCNATYTEVVSATGHSYDEGEITLLPTCEQEGEISLTCTKCNETLEIPVKPLGHDYSVVVSDDGEGTHHTECSRCGEVQEGSTTPCTYDGNVYSYDSEGNLHQVCDVCGGLSVDTVTTPTANDDGTYDYTANSGSSLSSALDALKDVETSDGAQSTITLTEDLTLDEGESGVFTIDASNVVLDGGEDGVTLSSGHEITVSGDNVTIKNITIDGSTTKADKEKYAHAIEINGNDVAIEGCTIIGGEATTYTSAVLIDLNPDAANGDDRVITITDCTITGAFRGIYLVNAGNVDLYVTGCYIESTYAFNETGGNNYSNLHFTDCSLMGWTSYAVYGEKSFTNCTLGYCDVGNNCTSYGFLRGYHGETIFTNCFFESGTSRQARTENTLNLQCYAYLGKTNYGFGTQGTDVVYTFLGCTFDNTSLVGGEVSVTTTELTADTGAYLMTSDFASSSRKDSSGFKFSTEEEATVYTYYYYSNLGLFSA